jgi:hypothetical protein
LSNTGETTFPLGLCQVRLLLNGIAFSRPFHRPFSRPPQAGVVLSL